MQDERAGRRGERRVRSTTPARSRSVCIAPEWHQGVIGIVASRLKDRYHRPVVVFARGGRRTSSEGSGRSIAGFHLRDALDLVTEARTGCRHPLRRARVRSGPVDRARPAARLHRRRSRTSPAKRYRTRNCSASTKATARIDAAGADASSSALTMGECVWGQGFPPPAFDDTFDVVAQRAVGDGHARLTLARGGERFNGDRVSAPPRRIAGANSRAVPAGSEPLERPREPRARHRLLVTAA